VRICFVYQTDYPWDVRVEKILRGLTSAGHRLTLVSANEKGRARRESLPEAEVVRLPHVRGVLRFLNGVINFPFFFNPFWIFAVARCVRKGGADLIVVRDLPLALTAVFVGWLYRVPVMMDMAECYPELLRNMWRYGNFNIVNVFARNPLFADWIERMAVRRLDHTFVMVEESRERLQALGADPARLSIVSNTPPRGKFEPPGGVEHAAQPPRPLTVVYAGWVNRGRGIDTVVEGMGAYVASHGRNVRLTVIGTGDAEAECRARSRELGLEDVISFKGWLDNERVVEHVLASDVGLVPHHVSGHWNNTVPNKLFDYMASGIAVLTSNTRPVARIVTETGSGLVYRDYDAADFAAQLARLAEPQIRGAMAARGREAVRARYNWEHDFAVLLKAVESCRKRA
jgi:glycosyltransferase involved in cell wall biosynthesis